MLAAGAQPSLLCQSSLVALRAPCGPRAPSSPVSGKAFAAPLLLGSPRSFISNKPFFSFMEPGLSSPGAEVSWCHGWTQGQPEPCALSSWQRLAGTRWLHTGPSRELLSTALSRTAAMRHDGRCTEPWPAVVCAPCAGSQLVSPGSDRHGQEPEPGTASSMGRASSWCSAAWRGSD